MNYLKQNIAYLNRQSDVEELNDLFKKRIDDLTISEIETIADQLNISFSDLLLKPIERNRALAKKVRFLILDVDGVMTDGGMYFSENGDQLKKYNTKDGMAIMELTKNNFAVGIISSGFKTEMVKSRASLLNIPYFYVGRESKMKILSKWCEDLKIDLSEVAIIGDDINDLSVMKSVGLSVCPADAVPLVKKQADIVLHTAGGRGCVREFIDHYLLDQPVEKKD